MARYLVTGGAGFIGRSLVKALIENGDDVVGLDRFRSHSPDIFQEKMNELF